MSKLGKTSLYSHNDKRTGTKATIDNIDDRHKEDIHHNMDRVYLYKRETSQTYIIEPLTNITDYKQIWPTSRCNKKASQYLKHT